MTTPTETCPHCGEDDCKPYYRPHGQECRSALCEMTERAKQAEAEVERMHEVVKMSNRIEREERHILQRWKEWGFSQEEKVKKLEVELQELQRLRPTRGDVKKLEAEVESLQAALDQMTRDAITTAKDRDEWMTRAMTTNQFR